MRFRFLKYEISENIIIEISNYIGGKKNRDEENSNFL